MKKKKRNARQPSELTRPLEPAPMDEELELRLARQITQECSGTFGALANASHAKKKSELARVAA